MPKLAFKIRGMDCAEEVALLKSELGCLVGGEQNLAFDLLAGKLTVTLPEAGGPGAAAGSAGLAGGSPAAAAAAPAAPGPTSAPVTPDTVVRAVARTGLTAIPWDEFCAAASCPATQSLWQRRGRLLLVAASGALLAAGFALHAAAHGWRHALAGAESGGAGAVDVGAAAAGAAAASAAAAGLGAPLELPLASRLCYLAAVVLGGWPIAPRAWLAARRLRPDMNLLMTIAVLGALAVGEWFEAGSVTFLFGLALWLESWSVGRARRAIQALVSLTPSTARYLGPRDGDVIEAPVGEVPVGATVLVRPGERIPLDGTVTSGTTVVNEAPLTGEALPVAKAPGDAVFAGTINGDGAIELRAEKAAADTTMARIVRMVEEAQARRAPSERWVERFARVYTPAMMWLALGIAVVPPLALGGDWGRWVYQALVVLVIACPCALVISTPVAIVAGLTTAARAGVLIKGGVFLELPARLRAVALDKTGTLTRGEPAVTEIVPLDAAHTPALVLARAAALEAHSTHPLARAIVRKAAETGVAWEPAHDLRARPGLGAEGVIEGRPFWLGSHRFLHERLRQAAGDGGAAAPAGAGGGPGAAGTTAAAAPPADGEGGRLHARAAELERAGRSVVMLGTDGHVCGLIALADEVRPEAAAAVRWLREAGIDKVVMLTGDHEGAARAAADAAGVDSYAFDLLPADKAARLRMLTEKYRHVAMVGDGINDAPALASSALGIAMGAAGSDVAIETADIALMTDDLRRLPWLVRHSRRVLRAIRENVAFSLVVKGTFLTLALVGVATLWMAIAADMGASLAVILNSLRLLDDRPSRAA